MENGKRYFDTKEFRDILNRYEQMKAENICSYFDADDLYNLLLYFLFYEKVVAGLPRKMKVTIEFCNWVFAKFCR